MPFQKKLANGQVNLTNGELMQGSVSDGEKIEVIGDGKKTYLDLFDEIVESIEADKLTPFSVLKIDTSILKVSSINTSLGQYTFNNTAINHTGDVNAFVTEASLRVNNNFYTRITIGKSVTRTSLGNNVASDNMHIVLYYR